MVNRLLTRAELTTRPGPHMGMALGAYTNCTSPLRKFLDFLVHLQIKLILHGDAPTLVTSEQVTALAARLASARAASQEAERWLAARYLVRITGEGNTRFTGTVAHINSSGFTVRLDSCGLEGLVDLRKDPEKFSYDKWTASLTSTTRRFQLEQAVEVEFAGIDDSGQNQALFSLVEGCGLKPPKPEAGPTTEQGQAPEPGEG
jgi:ribonuclease R